MAEYSANAIQTVGAATAMLYTESPVPCNRGLIFHRDGSGIFRLASPTRISGCNGGWGWTCPCPCCNSMPEAMYLVSFHANIAVPTGGTVEEISMAIAIDGDPDLSSTMLYTPAAVETYANVGAEVIVAVPAICGCESISVRNTSTQPILVQNANLVIQYQGIRG